MMPPHAPEGIPPTVTPALESSASDDPRVAAVLEEYLTALAAGQAPDRQAFLARHPELAGALETLAFVEGAAGQLPVPGGTAAGKVADWNPADALAKPLGDFRLVREIGHGGMGVVYEAVQLSLNRRVAVKVLPFAATLDARQLLRFQTEAQAAAGLHHPHIVPVYAVGHDRGAHYYAMQYIEGQSLASLVRELRRLQGLEAAGGPESDSLASALAGELASGRLPGPFAPQPEPAGRTAPPGAETAPAAVSTGHSGRDAAFFRTVAALGLQAAEALAHAHGQGIVHRDVKPGNLLVDLHGRLWVADFGLAQVQGVDGQTRTGDVVGTLRYLSPEQSQGQNHRVDARSDVYALGATLYELLTLEPAFAGNNREQLRKRIETVEPVPPRRINPAVPVDLETIALKALAKAPEERYASATALADDLQRFLEDKAVWAKRPTFAQRVRRWSRRHKTGLALATTALVAGVILGLSLSLAFAWQAQERAEAAQAKEAAQRERLEARTRLVRQSLDETSRVAQRLAQEPGMTLLQREFLLRVVALYEELLAQEGNADPEVRHAAALALFRVGSIHLRLLEREPGVRAYESALVLLRDLVREAPHNPAYRYDLYRTLWTLADGYQGTGQADKAEQSHRQSLAEARRLVDLFPQEPAYRDTLSNQGFNLGCMLRAHGKHPEAEAIHRAALDVADQLVHDYPERGTYPRNQALNLLGLSYCLAATGRRAGAEDALRMARTIGRKLAANYPAEFTYREEVAQYSHELALLALKAGRLTEAEQGLREYLEIMGGQARRFPHVVAYRVAVAGPWQRLGLIYFASGRIPECEQAFQRALETMQYAAEAVPTNASYRYHWSWCLSLCPLPRLRNPGQALRLAQEAVALAPGVPAPRVMVHSLALGTAHYRLGQWRDCERALERELTAAPDDPRLRFVLAMAYWQQKDERQARRWYDEANRRMGEDDGPGTENAVIQAEAAALLGPAGPPRGHAAEGAGKTNAPAVPP